MKKTISKKPVGQLTRGKTVSNRPRRVDNFILLYEPSLLTRTDGRYADSFFVDLGYGFDPRTTLESAARFRKLNPNLRIPGVEIDKQRVDAAIGMVTQETHLFHDTIRTNLTYAKMDATQAEIESAARAATSTTS